MIKKILKIDKFILILLFLGLFTTIPLFKRGYFTHHDDLQVIRIFEMRKCFTDLQIPCRWVSDMGMGYGYPLFNYYGVFPYYLGALLSFAFGYIGAVKVLYFLFLIGGGVSMYFFVKRVVSPYAGLISGVVYMFAPYRALDAYVRGAVSESVAIALVPLIFYFIFSLSEKKNIKNIIGLNIIFSLFLITHNIMTMLYVPIIMIWVVVTSRLDKVKLVNILPSLLFSFGIASFFLIPSFIEKNLVQVSNLVTDGLDYHVHFVSLRQIFFDYSWRYTASMPWSNNSISFQVGIPLWLLAGSTVLILLFKKARLYVYYFVGLFFISLFMIHLRSIFIWERIPIFKFVQFPWRFLGISIFAGSFLGGVMIDFLKNQKLKKIAVFIIIMFAFLFNIKYFRPERYVSIGDSQKLSGEEWKKQQSGAILDYLPNTAIEPKEFAPDKPWIVTGEGNVDNYELKSNRWSFNVNLEQDSEIIVPVFEFQNWKINNDGNEINHSYDVKGRIFINVPKGEHKIVGIFTNTPLRTVSNILSLISVIALLIYISNYEKR